MDYNIYIHDKTNGQSASHTKAWSKSQSSNTKSWGKSSQKSDDGGDMSMSAAWQALSGAVKSHPVVVALVAALTTTYKVVDTITPFVARETGDYRWAVHWNNLKATVNMMTKPFSTAMTSLRSYQEITLHNQKQEYNRELIGENIYTNSNRKNI